MPEAAVSPEGQALPGTQPGNALSRTNPFPGLRPYLEEDAAWFFGRSAEINDLLKRLRRLHFVAIVGDSGSGKSSVVRAGVLPMVRDGYLDSTWTIVTFRPGDQPIAHLREALAAELPVISDSLDDVLHSGPQGLVRAIASARLSLDARVLVLVDQFEELFQFAQRSGEAAQEEVKAFLKLLLAAVRSDDVPVYVVTTMRLEWLTECATYAGLAEAMNEGLYLVPPMGRRQFQQAILEPLDVAGGSITGSLTDRMLNDLNNRTDQLPVLQHALMRLWERTGPATPLDNPTYIEVGTLSNCLSRHAEEIFGELSPAQQALAEKLFRAITQVTQNRKARRPRPVSEILALTGASLPELGAVINAFAGPKRSFLVTTQGALRADSIVDLSHEALIRQWERLSGWVESEAEVQSRLRRLAEDAADWDGGTRLSQSTLYRGSQLARFEPLVPLLPADSPSLAFLRASVRARFWYTVARFGIGIFAMCMAGVGIFNQLSSQRDRQRAAQKVLRLEADRAQSDAKFAQLQAAQAQQFSADIARKIQEANGSKTALAAIASSITAPRIYVQYAGGQLALARTVQARLQAKGYVVPGVEAVAANTVPPQSQVRFFHEGDRMVANQIAGVVRAGTAGDVLAQGVNNPRQIVPEGQFEVWLVPAAPINARTNTPAPSDSSTAAASAANKPATPEPAPVQVAPPTLTASLSVDHVTTGTGAKLTWSSGNAEVTINNGIGQVAPNGTLTVAPQQSTTYELTAKNAAGSMSKSVVLTVSEPPPVAKAPIAAAVVNNDLAGVKAALTRYREAYESESIDDLRKAWPTISSSQVKDTQRSFAQFNAIRLELNCADATVHVEGNSASATCQQKWAYSQRGTKLPLFTNTGHFRLGKQGDAWVVMEATTQR